MTTATQNLEITLMKSLLKNTGINIKNEIVKSLIDKTIVGFFCVASSQIRKPTTVKNVKQFIIENNLPLVVETGSDFDRGFKIMIIEQPGAQPVFVSTISEMKFNLSLASGYLSMVEVCNLNIKKGNDVGWWQEKRIQCLTMFESLSKVI